MGNPFGFRCRPKHHIFDMSSNMVEATCLCGESTIRAAAHPDFAEQVADLVPVDAWEGVLDEDDPDMTRFSATVEGRVHESWVDVWEIDDFGMVSLASGDFQATYDTTDEDSAKVMRSLAAAAVAANDAWVAHERGEGWANASRSTSPRASASASSTPADHPSS